MSGAKERLIRILKKELNSGEHSLLDLFVIAEDKNGVTFRMPASFFSMEDLWDKIKGIAEKNKIHVSRKDLYATVKELDNILTNIEWIWRYNLAKGFVTLVAGEPGIGKSLVVLDFAKRITNGLCFPMSEEKYPGNVFWIDTEMKQQLLMERSKSLGMNRDNLFIPSIGGNLLARFNASDEKHREHVVNVIEDKQPALMVIDSFGHSHSKGENKIEEVRPVMDFLTSVARDYNMGVILVHHLNKGREDESAEISLARVRGSTDIVATPVVIYALEKHLPGTIKVRQIKNNIGKSQPPLVAQFQYIDEDKELIKGITYEPHVPPPPKRNKKEVCADWVVEQLRNSDKGVPLVELVRTGEKFGYSRANLYAAQSVIGEKMVATGTGNISIWTLIENQPDHEAIKKLLKGRSNGK